MYLVSGGLKITRKDLSHSPITAYDHDISVVKKVAGGYKVSPKKARDIVAMILLFKDDVISSVSLEMKEGSVNTYTFTDVEFEVDDALFDVDIPDDAEIDDERGAN